MINDIPTHEEILQFRKTARMDQYTVNDLLEVINFNMGKKDRFSLLAIQAASEEYNERVKSWVFT